METDSLSPRRMADAQKKFYLFSLLNVISFQLLTGNIITLYALRLGAGNLLIGLLYSFIPLAQVLPFLGRLLIKHLGTVRTFGLAWLIRYLMMIPILFAPLFAGGARPEIGISLIVISVIGFNLARGIGLAAHNPIIGGITTEKDRGSFLSGNQIIVHSGVISTGIAMALLLGRESSLMTYTILLAIGIMSGFMATTVIFGFPEPQATKHSYSAKFLAVLKKAFKRRGFQGFIVFLVFQSFIVSMVTPFLVVFMKKVYLQGDSTVVFLTVIGSTGAIVMALVSGFVIDRLGAKPLISIFAGIITLVLIPLATAPGIQGRPAFLIYAGTVFFFITMGTSGMMNGTNTYFFALIRPEERLNLGIVYFLATGTPAALGSLFGGAILDFLGSTGLGLADIFRIYFGTIIIAFIVILMLVSNLAKLGAFAIRDVLNIFISPRDLRALSLLHRLKSPKNITDQRNLIKALGETHSAIPIEDLLRELKSPKFVIRSEALSALSLVKPNNKLKKALIDEVKSQHYTTAYLAAEILGKHNVGEGLAALRNSLKSRDFFLQSKSMVALAKLNDRESIKEIENLVAATRNPRLIIHGVAALELFKSPSSIPVMLDKLKEKTSPLIKDEIILALAGLLGMTESFYPLYTGYLEDPATALSELQDSIDELREKEQASPENIELLHELVSSFKANSDQFPALLQKAVSDLKITVENHALCSSFLEAAGNQKLGQIKRFYFFLLAVCIFFRSEN